LTTSSLSCRQEYSTTILVSGPDAYSWTTTSVWADAVFLRFQLTDIVSTAPPTSTSSTDAAATATSAGTGGGSGGLSTGAKVGIGLGIPLFLVLCGLGFGWWLIFRRRRRATPAVQPVTEDSHGVQAQYLGANYGSWHEGYPVSSNESGKRVSGLPTSESGTHDLPEFVR
jgi:hypothetical protein